MLVVTVDERAPTLVLQEEAGIPLARVAPAPRAVDPGAGIRLDPRGQIELDAIGGTAAGRPEVLLLVAVRGVLKVGAANQRARDILRDRVILR
jgi:hypothetical protein